MKRAVVYVAGPISKGDLAGNVLKAHEAGMALLKAGLSPIVPHGNCFWGNKVGFVGREACFAPEVLPAGTVIEDWYLADLPIVRRCDAVLRLPGESTGADLEVAEAVAAGIPVFGTVAQVAAWAAEEGP